MKTFISLLAVHFRQAVFSFRFLFSVCAVVLVLTFTVWDWITNFEPHHDAIYFYVIGIGGGSLFLLTGIIPLFTFATSFASEWEQRATSFWMIRTGIRTYSVSKIIMTALTGFLVTALGFWLFILLLAIKYPLLSFISTGDAYVGLLEAEAPVKYLLFHITHTSLTSALFAVTALWVSTYIPNTFVTIASPLVIYMIAHRFTSQLEIPEYLKALTIVETTYDAGSPISTLLLKLVTVVVLCMLMGFMIVRQIRRRVFHA